MVRAGLLSDDQLAAVQVRSAERKLSFVEALLELGVVDEDSVVSFLHSKLMIPRVGASVLDTVDKGALLRIPPELANKHAVLPISADETGNLTVAMVDPTDMRAVDAISAHTGAYLVRAVAPLRIIRAAISRHYGIPMIEPPTPLPPSAAAASAARGGAPNIAPPTAAPTPAPSITAPTIAGPAASITVPTVGSVPAAPITSPFGTAPNTAAPAPAPQAAPNVAVPAARPATVQPTTIVPGTMMVPPVAPPVLAAGARPTTVAGAPGVAPPMAASTPVAPTVQPPAAAGRPPSSATQVAVPTQPQATPTRPPTATNAPVVAPARAPSGPNPVAPAATIKPSAVIRPTAVIQPSAVFQPSAVIQPSAVVMPGPRPAVVLPASAQHSNAFGPAPGQALHPAFTPISTQPPTDVATIHASAQPVAQPPAPSTAPQTPPPTQPAASRPAAPPPAAAQSGVPTQSAAAQTTAPSHAAAPASLADFQPGGTATFEPAPQRRPSPEPRPVNDDDETPPKAGDTLVSGSRADVVDIPLDDLEDHRGQAPTRTIPPEDPDERVPTSTWTPPQFGVVNEVIPLSPEAFHRLLPRFSAVKTRDEVTDLLLDFLAEGFSRVIMFTHIKGEIRGRDARGEDLMVDAVRQIRIPATGPSLFSSVIDRRQPYFGPMRTDTAIDAAFYSALGGVDGVVLCLPVVLRDKVPLLVFASGSHNPVDPRSLQELTTEVSAALERLIVLEKARQK